jgi:hypothetical protein
MATLDPVHGPHDPAPGTPPRVPGSVRRTTTVDTSFPEGLAAPRRVDARGRDLRTAADGSPEEVAAVRLSVVLDPLGTVREIGADPPEPGLDALVGASVSMGFRKAIDAHLPHLAATGGLLFVLLDDLPGASLVSGVAFQHVAAARSPVSEETVERMGDICAGWAVDGAMLTFSRRRGESPLVIGPSAPVLERDDDPDAWHPHDPLPLQGSRRRRRIDVVPEPDGSVRLDVHFRDSHCEAEGSETVVHEYTVAAVVDPATGTFVEAEAGARVLPWNDCPTAAASASRLAGTSFAGLRRHVRTTFVGTSTCTHLNDTLRGLEDVPALLAHLPAPGR